MTRLPLAAWIPLGVLLATSLARSESVRGQEPATFAQLADRYDAEIRPLLARYCHDCHDAANKEGELDLARFATLDDLRADPAPWQLVARLLDSGEMPPEEADQPTAVERNELRTWVGRFLDAEARSRAGDPGPVVLRRLNNAEYAYTLRDLTGVAELDPAREFPPDGAAGEGFSNAGQALSMSPALAQKYLDAAKDVSRHVVLLPDGIRFSPGVSRRDWTDEALAAIRDFYRERSVPLQSAEVRLQGLVWESADGGKIPLAKYFEATVVDREALRAGSKSLAVVAAERGLNERYLTRLWQALNDDEPSPLLDPLRDAWRAAGPEDVAALVMTVESWQQALWKFNRVGHLGRVGGPASWMEPVSPLATKVDLRVPLSAMEIDDVTMYLSATTPAGAGEAFAIWRRPRLVAKDGSELLLRDVRPALERFERYRSRTFASADRAFAAIEASQTSPGDANDLRELAETHGVKEEELAAWMEILGIGQGAAPIAGLLETPLPQGQYDFVRGWGRPETPSGVVNLSDQEVRIPGTLPGRSVAVHPSPELDAGVAWRSPVDATLNVAVAVRDSHDACGNGLAWTLELRRASQRLALATDRLASGASSERKLESVVVRRGDVVALVVGAADRDHVCDLTGVDLTLVDEQGDKTWDLSADLTKNAPSNPAPDQYGNAGVWSFFAEPVGVSTPEASPGSDLIAGWLLETGPALRRSAREALARLFVDGPTATSTDAERALYARIASAGGPLFRQALSAKDDDAGEPPVEPEESAVAYGLAPSHFGATPEGSDVAVDADSLAVRAPSALAVRLPREFADRYDFVAEGLTSVPTTGDESPEAVVQMTVSQQPPVDASGLRPDVPLLVGDDPAARAAIERDLTKFRDLFPAALCYTKIVPIDEVVTLRLIHREDEPLRRLFLSPEEIAWLDRAWDELHFVGHDALRQVDAFEQLMEYATQDADPSVFAPLREPIREAARAFERQLVEAEPAHVAAAIDFAERAWRRPLSANERERLHALYQELRAAEMQHDEAIRTLVARALVSPAFLYRLEQAPPGEKAGPVNDHELAVRLSYFLWASPPDEELRAAADAGRLSDPEELRRQTRRMLTDPRVERLAREFGSQWLHVRDFATSNEKSETAFPEFAALRDDLAEEPVRFFADFFANDRPIASLFDSDAVFATEPLANFYGIPWSADEPTDDGWRRIENANAFGRGGILAMGAVLAKQSGASRTSPVLRGTWISESLLGERLPRPPKGVPPLPEETPAGLTERELVARHAADASCAKCHVRIDPFGFALESYDGIGRRRETYPEGQPIDDSASLVDGTEFVGVDGLRRYLLGPRREETTRQFCRKLLGYALGRGVRLSDEPLLDEMLANLDANEGRISAAVATIVLSEQFRYVRGADWPAPSVHEGE